MTERERMMVGSGSVFLAGLGIAAAIFVGLLGARTQDVPVPVVVGFEIRSIPVPGVPDCPLWQAFLPWSDGSVERSILNPQTGKWSPFVDMMNPMSFDQHRGTFETGEGGR